MKKKIYLTFLLCIFVVIIGSTISSAAVADTPTFPNKARFNRGVGNTCYYVSSSASAYTGRINTAANRWVHTGVGANPIYMTPVSSTRQTHIDIYGKKASSDSVLSGTVVAYVSFWSSTATRIVSAGQEPKKNYFYTEIIIDTAETITAGTIVHEMGHCFGLKHYASNKKSIMYPYENRSVSTVQTCDNNTINALY